MLPFDLGAWPESSDPRPAAPDPARPVRPVRVQLLDVPVAALNRAAEQYEALFREFRLVVEQGPSNPCGAPERLLAVIDELGTRFAGFAIGIGIGRDWRAAVARGDTIVDLTLDVPATVGPACEHYDRLLDQADHFCRAAELITLPATPEAVALRKWLLLEFSRQVAGHAPVPWSASARGNDPAVGNDPAIVPPAPASPATPAAPVHRRRHRPDSCSPPVPAPAATSRR